MSSPSAPALELRGIVKSFGSVQALRGADLVLARGEVHALLGENGAGKSTLLRIAYGMLAPDAGTLRLRGQPVSLRSPRAARAAGIGMVHQHFTSIGALTVRENIALAVGRYGAGPQGALTGELMRGLEADTRAESLGVALRQRLEIVKALATGASILLLDEPSAVLAPSEIDELLGQLRRFVLEGGTVVLVTHKLPEVMAAADRVTVLRGGVSTLSGPVREQSVDTLAVAMIGTSGPLDIGKSGSDPAPPPGLPTSLPPGLVTIGAIAIHPGELIGIAAIEGNGQRELLRQIAARRDVRVALVPEDRTTEGLIPAMSVAENVVLGLGRDARWSRGPLLNWEAARGFTAGLIHRFNIQAPGPDVAAGILSGGNQQKLVLARALEARPRVLVAENPTRGLDVRATADVHERLREATRQGTAVIVYSTDLDEVLELGQRVLVVHQGTVREAPRGADRRVVGDFMLGIQA